VNDGLAFVEFIAEHPVGSRVEGTVDSFSSHGAWVQVGAVRCYAPLRSLGDPAPRSAREVLGRAETRTFVVDALDAPRRGIDLALPGFEHAEAAAEAPVRPASADQPVGASAVTSTAFVTDQASAAAGATQPESEATLATKATKRKATGTKKKAAVKKKGTAVKRKATTKKATAAKKTKATGTAVKRKATATKKKAAPRKKKAATKRAASPAKKTARTAKKTVKKAKATGRATVKKATKAVKRATKR